MIKPATIVQLKSELRSKNEKELIVLCLELAKATKQNKDFLSFLLFSADNISDYLQSCKDEIDEGFLKLRVKSLYHKKKAIRSVLKKAKARIKPTKDPEFEVELLIYFCTSMSDQPQEIKRNHVMRSLVERQMELINRIISKMHEDLQYDYKQLLDNVAF